MIARRLSALPLVLALALPLAVGCSPVEVADGGQTTSQGPSAPALTPTAAAGVEPCTAGGSVVSTWIGVALSAIRRDLPAPTVHARNLYHVSAAMWDAWAAHDPDAEALFASSEPGAGTHAREIAIAHAAHAVLRARYADSVGGAESLAEFDVLLAACDLLAPPGAAGEGAADPRTIGESIAREVLEATSDDGAVVATDSPPHTPVNPPLVVSGEGTDMVDPDRWQPLALEAMVTQNGIPLDTTVQAYVGWRWGEVEPFALEGGIEDLVPDPPPRLGDFDGGAGYRAGALAVLLASSQLDPRDGQVIDISPGAVGNSTLGADDGRGHAVNPVTGEPYEANLVRRADHHRAVAEFWADGPTSETPPGHWNTLALDVTDELSPEDLRIAGEGEAVDRLEWDVKLHLVLNGALHDAAVAAWGVKALHESARPISMIRHLAALGQSSNPEGPSYNPQGIPLASDLVEVVTAASAAAGERHEALAGHVGEIAIRTWTPTVATAGDPSARVRWILASTWVPYQRPTFVTPAFPGYVSGHSTFSRAGAEVLTAFTGSPWFPGGLGTWDVPAGALAFEDGPTEDIRLEWATYADAADDAGRSRIFGGIHVPADDHAGRILGARVAASAWERAREVWGR